MADFGVVDNGFFEFNSVDLSGKVMEANPEEGIEALDDSRWGTTTRIFTPGLKTGSFRFRLIQDFAASNVDATFRDAVTNRTKATLKYRPTNAVAATTNPERSATVFITRYIPFSGSVGENATAEVEFVLASAITITTS